MAVDLPPFGLTKTAGFGNAVDYSRVAQAKRILSLIEAVGSPVTLVGHSFGSGPALEAAMRGGDKLRQLVLVDPALGLGTNGESPQCDAAAGPGLWLSNRQLRTTLVSATATWPGLSATLLRQFVHRKEVVTERLVPAYQLPFRRQAFSAKLGDWAASFSQAACKPTESLNIDKLSQWATGAIPLVLIWGEEDTITPIAQGTALLRWMPGATMTVVPGVGHIPHIESPDAFAAVLLGAVRPAH